MITLLTGVPGSGKSLHAVSELLLPMQNAHIEHEGQQVKRTLYTNIKNLLLDHVLIDKDDLLKWPDWVKPGDLICFDEVQEVWRPRGMSAATPESIAKLETHRHMGVDFIIVTQHPMLLDQNIRRLVGRHLHVRRVANMALAVVYEWDHASNPSMVKSAITTRPWRYPKSAYKLYKSADAHTKQPRKLPFALLVMMLAGGGLAYGVYTLQGRLSERYGASAIVSGTSKPSTTVTTKTLYNVPPPPDNREQQITAAADQSLLQPERPLGCIATVKRCNCYDQGGYKVPMPDDQCRAATNEMLYIVREAKHTTTIAAITPIAVPEKQSGGGDPLGEGKALKSVNVPNGPVANTLSSPNINTLSQRS